MLIIFNLKGDKEWIRTGDIPDNSPVPRVKETVTFDRDMDIYEVNRVSYSWRTVLDGRNLLTLTGHCPVVNINLVKV